MWGLPTEAKRLLALRRAAYEALAGQPPLRESIRLSLIVHVGCPNARRVGDLGSFVAGVCDGLMAAAPGAKLDDLWSNLDLTVEALVLNPEYVSLFTGQDRQEARAQLEAYGYET